MKWLTHDNINKWRTVPRLMVFWYAILVWHVTDWFIALQTPTTEQASFAAVIVGLSTAIFGLYVNSGPSKREVVE